MATVDRVLPWRRHHSAPIEEIAPLLTAFRKRHPKASVALVNRAYESARIAHISQMRSSGEAYINHPIAVARIVADIGLDDISLAAALLHDAVEDTEITLEDVQRDFGDEVSLIDLICYRHSNTQIENSVFKDLVIHQLVGESLHN